MVNSSRPQIGGQAVMEGVMMNGQRHYSVAVRAQDGSIKTKVFEHHRLGGDQKFWNLPLFRGMVRFIDSLIIGIKTLDYSASYFTEEPDETKKPEESGAGTIVISLVLALALAIFLFTFLPVVISQAIFRLTNAGTYLLGILEGLVRMGIFLLYLWGISFLKDIRRTFEYHGAEHKSIHCFEAGLPLTVENVKKQTRFHKRCGTSFLFIILLISMLIFAFIPLTNGIVRFLLHLAALPLIAGFSYEILKLSAHSRSRVLNALVQPGLWIQHLTTREPDDQEIEVGIASVLTLLEAEGYSADESSPAEP